MTRVRELAAALMVFTAAAVAVTWPLAAHFGTESVQHGDVYFNMWRMEWFAHALRTAPSHVFDANIFYPEPGTLAYSDAMLLEDSVAAPLYAARVAPVFVHNLMLLAGMVLSATGMFLLATYLTKSRGAGLIAGVVFAFAPFRLDHIAHMELQWAMWSPLAFLALHRLLETGKWRDGIATGACLALQMLSSIYYGIFLAVLLSCAAVLLIAIDRRVSVGRATAALAAGAAIALLVSAAYSRPYVHTHATVGDRSAAEVDTFSGRAASYLAVPPENRALGAVLHRGGASERRLFPGIVPVVLALAGLLVARPSRRMVVYMVLLVLAFDMSLGLRGFTFGFLYGQMATFRSLRAAARVSVFVLLFLGVLAAYGYAILTSALPIRWRRAVVAGVLVLLVTEYSTALKLTRLPNVAPPVYRVLARQPRGVVAELPVPRLDLLPGDEPARDYMSTFHWFPLVNGYSGNYPPSYLARIDRLRGFPDGRSLRQLRTDGVRYVVVHAAGYSSADLADIRQRLASGDPLVELGTFDDGEGAATLYLLRGT